MASHSTAFDDQESELLHIIREGLRVNQIIEHFELAFRVVLHCDIHELCKLRHKLTSLTDLLRDNGLLVEAGFRTILSENDVNEVLDKMTKSRDKLNMLVIRLVPYHDFGLSEYMNVEERAAELDIRVKQISEQCDMEVFGGRWDRVLENVCEALKISMDRDRILPLWNTLEDGRRYGKKKSRRTAANPTGIDVKKPTHMDLILCLVSICDYFSPEHSRYLCDKYNFYCQFLDDEVRNICSFMTKRFTDPAVRYAASTYVLSEAELCDLVRVIIRTVAAPNDYINSRHVRVRFSIRFYRACLKVGYLDLAREWMRYRLGYTMNTNEVCCDILEKTSECLRKKADVIEPRISLNGRHTGISNDYQLPELKLMTLTSSDSEPWWVAQLKAHPVPENYEMVCQGSEGYDSSATTVAPSESRVNISPLRLVEIAAKERQEAISLAAEFYRDQSRLSDRDMCSVAFATIFDPETAEEERLVLKWKDYHDCDQQRVTNLLTGKPYHCRAFSYDALSNEWSGTDEFCEVRGLLDVHLKGAMREILVGADGRYYESVFKMYRHPADHRIDNYLADVRAQTIAAYYADRFRRITNDQFGRLRIINAEFYLFYDSVERKQIIDFVSREERLGSDTYNHFSNFGKYTNNWTWKNREVTMDIFEAFSHFSYQESEGVLMVTDLQGFTKIGNGIDYVLTDPVIHCQTRKWGLFGKTNYGTDGMNKFFSSVHRECNYICDYLKLRRPELEEMSEAASTSDS